MRLGVIPARGGSRRIPRKNIRPFAGRPMLAWAVAAARASGVVDRLIVSTDDAEIAEIARREGAETPFVRPADLADDHATTAAAMAHAVAACRDLGWAPETVLCLYPAVPLLEPKDIARGLDLLDGWDGHVFPVAAYPAAIQRALRRDETGFTTAFDLAQASVRSQDLEPAYYDAGQFYWASAETWLAGRSPHAHARTLVLPAWRAVDIDTEEDWARAELTHRAVRS